PAGEDEVCRACGRDRSRSAAARHPTQGHAADARRKRRRSQASKTPPHQPRPHSHQREHHPEHTFRAPHFAFLPRPRTAGPLPSPGRVAHGAVEMTGRISVEDIEVLANALTIATPDETTALDRKML